jgi:peptidoglycan hydrolase-like amidase
MNPAAVVVISVFGLFRPSTVEVAAIPGHPAIAVSCGAQTTRLEGSRALRLSPGCKMNSPGRFVLSVPGKIQREFAGRLEVRGGPVLTALVSMDLETAVASVVASEIPGDVPAAALEALAIAARSYYVSSKRGRHEFNAFCDSTHCQHIRGVLAEQHRAVKAASSTRGLVLDYESRVVSAMYSAACQGRRQEGVVNSDGYPYAAVPCDYCRRNPVAKRGSHERGLCQSGAIDLAKQGKSAAEILQHYYPGTRVRRF